MSRLTTTVVTVRPFTNIRKSIGGFSSAAGSRTTAVYLTFTRSPYFALGYAANDVVLIVLWVLASIKDFSYISVVICFVVFLVNDIYGFVSWKRMQKTQQNDKNV